MTIYDISVPISVSTPVFPGDPKVEIISAASIAQGDAANVTTLKFGAHTATHVDAPAHFIETGNQVKNLSLDTLIGAAHVIEIPDDARAVTLEHVRALVPPDAVRVLFKTRNSGFWQPLINHVENDVHDETASHFHEDFTYIEPEAARELVRRNVRLVGLDYLSVEQFHAGNFATHEALLRAEIIIIEGLNLAGVASGEYELICLPLKIASGTGDGAPARTVLRTLR
ncbi:MAG: cyclase family protein [Pyrinomonadaceae bacterium MAG19_C2-C3]|nr:cyclase family protein [Pyrinomonadaceae bacterium MAG19_C2-C3]